MASKFYEELNKRPASDMDLDGSGNFDVKIGFILKEMIKMAKATANTGDINFIDIVDLLKALLEESSSVSILKCEIVFYVFEYLLISDIKELYNCDLMPKIIEVIFQKYLKKKEFDSLGNFCKYLSRKFESIYKNRINKKAKFVLTDTAKENFKVLCLYFIFQNQYFYEKMVLVSSDENQSNKMQLEQIPNTENSQQNHQIDEETTKSFLSISRNFMKVMNTLGLYDKKLDSLKEILYSLNSTNLIMSLQLFLAGVFTRFKAEETQNPEEKALKTINEILGGSIVAFYY